MSYMPEPRPTVFFKVTANEAYHAENSLYSTDELLCCVLGIWGTSKIVITLLGQKEDRLKTIIGPSK